MRKKISATILTTLLCVALVGCGHEHEWKEATCTEPKTCATCGEVEGEALGHTFAEATCTEPITCSVCGLTEGKAIGHVLSEPTYQTPATCGACGATEGEPLTPNFVENAIPGQFMEVGKEYDYVTNCSEDSSKKTVGKLTITNYQTIASDDTHEAKEGYEWKLIDFQVVRSDENANRYGFWGVRSHVHDYYVNLEEEAYNLKSVDGIVTFQIKWNGQDYTECQEQTTWESLGWQGTSNTSLAQAALRVPVGYDGTVLSFYDPDGREASGLDLDDNGVVIYPNENVLHFRFQ